MNHFIDFEFLEDGTTIMPISLGMVDESGKNTLYIEFQFDEQAAQQHYFIKEHVLPHLSWPRGRRMTKRYAQEFILDHLRNDKDPVFWAYYADYDWVVMCQLFGTMMDLPQKFPHLCMDLQQWWIQLGRPSNIKPAKPNNAHNALADALWNLEFYNELLEHSKSIKASRG